MKKLALSIIFTVLILSLSPLDSWAQMHRDRVEPRPFGGYCRGPRWGWYGAPRDVKSTSEVRQLLKEFLKDTELSVGEIRDMGRFYEADIVEAEENAEGGIAVVDVLVVDKRTCRIRSKY
jgi:hypothetical protein